jgi:hypothetical protein
MRKYHVEINPVRMCLGCLAGKPVLLGRVDKNSDGGVMPTCKYKPCAVLPKFKGESGTEKTSFFPAELWEDEHGGQPGMYRVMIGDKWHTRHGEQISFFTLEGISRLILLHLNKGLGVEPEQLGVLPDVPHGTLVRYWPHGQTQPTDTRTRTNAFQDAHGEWRVWVFFKANPILLAELEYRKEPKKEQQAVLNQGTRRSVT